MTTRRTPKRYPLEPLATLIGITLHTNGGHATDDEHETLADLAQRLGITHRHARRLLQHGLTEDQADTYAARLDLHPDDVWPEWFNDYELDPEAIAWLDAWDEAWANWHPPLTPPEFDR